MNPERLAALLPPNYRCALLAYLETSYQQVEDHHQIDDFSNPEKVYAFKEILDRLSHEAKEFIKYVLYADDAYVSPTSGKVRLYAIQNYLLSIGWTLSQVNAAKKEIREFVKKFK